MFTPRINNEYSPVFLKEVKPSNYIHISKIFSNKLKPLKGGVLLEIK